MKVYWFCGEQSDVPSDTGWLHPAERAVLASLRFEKRRREWLAGRWVAKRALAGRIGASPSPEKLLEQRPMSSDIEIRAAPDGAPEVYIRGRRASLSISISHRDDLALCAFSLEKVQLGCDLERIEERSRAFIADYLTERERAAVEAAPVDRRPLVANLIWSAKESALKALRTGLRRDTRSVAVILAETPGEEWSPLQVRDRESSATLFGWMRKRDERVLTIVSDCDFERPVRLSSSRD